MAVPNIFANATTTIPLSQLDQNFATAITLGNTPIYLGNTTTTINNLTLTNCTIQTVTFSNVATFLDNIEVNSLTVGQSTGGDSAVFGVGTAAGDNSVAVGAFSNANHTSGSENTAIGAYSLSLTGAGGKNVAIGFTSLYTNTGADNNTAVGHSALYSNTGNNNTAVGFEALYSNTTATGNVACGYRALKFNTTGVSNTAYGSSSLQTNVGGQGNTAYGSSSLFANISGNFNVAVGRNCLAATTTGVSNTALGDGAGYGSAGAPPANTTGTNNTFIGANSVGASATASNVITLGNSSIATLRCQVTTITSLSDRRDKTNIVDIPAGLSFIQSLKPVSFDWNMRDGGKVGITEFGFIAQDLQDAQNQNGVIVPNLVSEENPDKLEASAGTLIPVLVKAIQELKAELDLLKSKVES